MTSTLDTLKRQKPPTQEKRRKITMKGRLQNLHQCEKMIPRLRQDLRRVELDGVAWSIVGVVHTTGKTAWIA